MGKNSQLETILSNMPDYESCRQVFFDNYQLIQKLGILNYSGLSQRWDMGEKSEEIVCVFLIGMALGKAEVFEKIPDLYETVNAWKMVEDELAAIRPAPVPPTVQSKK